MARASKPAPAKSALGDLIDIAFVSPDGLMVTPDGRYVRTLEISRVPNLFSASYEERERVTQIQRRLAAAIPDEHELAWHVLRQPLPPALVSEPDRLASVRAGEADRAEGNAELAEARRRLQSLTAHTVTAAAEGDIGASWTRHFVQVIWRPLASTTRDKLMRGEATRPQRSGRVLGYGDHYKAAMGSLELLDRVAGRLTDARAHARPLSGVECLALNWERLHPAAGPYPFPDDFAEVCHYLPGATEIEAAAQRAAIVEKLVAGFPEYDVPRAEISTADPRHITHADGTVEEMLYLSRQPGTVDSWWLDPLSQTPLASSLVVRISPERRSTTRVSTRASVARAHAAADNAKRTTLEDAKVLGEKEAVQAQLDSEAGATIYKAAVYLSLREVSGDAGVLSNVAGGLSTEYRSHRDAGLVRGGRLGVRGWRATLPSGHDPLRRTTRWAPSDVPYLAPLSSSRCGHDRGIPLGFAWPHATLDRLDPFDDDNGTHIIGITGKGGHGKTLTANVLAARLVARGMTLRVIDRSTSADAVNGTRTGGHYDALLSLIPGARRVSIGTDDASSARINPWDVADPEAVHESQIAFLTMIHDLLIGDSHDGGLADRRLAATDRAIIQNAITEVYERLAATAPNRRDDPTESLLIEVLEDRMGEVDEETQLRPRYAALLERLRPFWGDGRQSFLLDQPTTVPTDAPAIVFDTTGVPQDRLPAVQLIVLQAITTEAERLTQKRNAATAAGHPLPEWYARPAVVIEEIWHLTATQAGVQMVEEWARRGRHLAMVLVWVTQFLSDLDSEGGSVLLKQSAATISHHQDSAGLVKPGEERGRVLSSAAMAAGLTIDDVDVIASLTTRKGEYAEAFIRTSQGRGLMRMAYAPPEFWALAQDPSRQQPLRAVAVREAGGDPWRAIVLLADPDWRRRAAAGV